MNTTTTTPEQFEYKAEMKQLLHLIVHSLYTHPEVFVRELVSNASDALNKIRFQQLTDATVLDAGAPLEIRITADKDAHTFVIEDTGIGMTKDDLVHKLGTIASSGTLEFIKQLQESKAQVDGNMIGQFGVGFYSAFMVADDITVETRNAAPDSVGLRWQSDGKGSFTIEEIDKPSRGTRIAFSLKESATEFSDAYRLKSIIQKYSNFVDFPIFIDGEKANNVRALWQQPTASINVDEANEFYKFIASDYQNPLGFAHVSIEGSVNFKALVFVPETAPLRPFALDEMKSLHLYANKVLIQENCKELLPDYLRFLRGVVDTEDLPLNVSREITQSSPVMAKINKVLTGKILALLQDWATNDTAKYDKFYRAFGSNFKIGINTDFLNRDAITNLLRFETTIAASGELVSLKDYVSRMKTDQTEIYYLAGESREAMLSNPNIEYFRKHGVEVLLLADPVDIIIAPSIPAFEGKSLKSIDKADVNLELGTDNNAPKAASDTDSALLALFKTTLGDNVEDVVVSKRLVDSAVTLVVGNDGMDVQMERMMKMMDKDFRGARKVLEVNMEHPLLQNMTRLYAADSESALVRQYIQQLYDAATLIESNLTSPAQFVRRMTEIMTVATQ
jgi:molecular chaperone HtpG